MIFSTQTHSNNKTKQNLSTYALMLVTLCLSVYAHSASWPDTPLGVSVSSQPMTMIVAGKDHKLFYEAYNDASDIDGDGVLDTHFKPSITYYGLYDSNLCYDYQNNMFRPSALSTNGKCSGAWSGNWLNYATTSRIDALRKVLYGGYRSTDTESQTILERSYIPQDAHSWAKEYSSPSLDGYRISDYTPLSLPVSGRRHFFGNSTQNANKNCSNIDNCSSLPPHLMVVQNSPRRVWEWASKERPVLDGSHGGYKVDYIVRVEVCTAQFNEQCKLYPNGQYKPVGLLHDYGEDESMFFGLLTGSYNKNMSGGVLRKVVSSFRGEVNTSTGQFSSTNDIVRSFDKLRIRDFNNGSTGKKYHGGWQTDSAMSEGRFVDWGNPIAEMMYEGLRYFAGKASPTSAFHTTGGDDAHIGLSASAWDNPFSDSSQAKANWCAKSNMLVMSDINPSFDSDQLPGSYFGSISNDLSGLDVRNLASTISSNEPSVGARHFIGQSFSNYDGAPTVKNVSDLGTIRGLAPEEPTKQGSYYSASVAYYGKTHDLNPVQGDQTVDSFYVALASPLPKISFGAGNQTVTMVPFAKSVGTNGGEWANFQPTNQIVDFYVDTLANLPGAPQNNSINQGRPYAKFRINFEDVEQGADHDMDAITEYEILLTDKGKVKINVNSAYAAGGIIQHMGYIISGTTNDGTFLVIRDLGHPESADPDYVLDYPNTPGALPFTSSLEFTPGSSSGSLLKDPLWYAAKWGGFIDKNDNNIPDLQKEWDANEDGTPDTYFLVQNPLKLKESLEETLDNILERSASSGNISANSSSISNTTLAFTSTYSTVNWSGDVHAYPITDLGAGSEAVWSASEMVPYPNSRRIYTVSDNAGKAFWWDQLSASDQAALVNADNVNYIRGVRDNEKQNSGILRNRNPDNILGDFVHSATYYEKDTDTVYVGANDGMLHAFNAETGRERFAFIPSAVLPKLAELTEQGYIHEYYVDGRIAISSQAQTQKNYLVSTLGRGGKGLFSLDVSNPASFNETNINWEYLDSTDPDLGYILGEPLLVKANNGDWVVIVGNGYDSEAGSAVLYIFDLESGALLSKIDTGSVGSNGLSSPAAYDADSDGDADYIYAGDLNGNVWKFNITNSNSSFWHAEFSNNGVANPLFTALTPDGTPQPITAQLNINVNDDITDPNYGKLFVFFGTGSYFKSSDPTNLQLQSLYALIDEGSQISGRSDLKERNFIIVADMGEYKVRSVEEAVYFDMDRLNGWYIDFDNGEGERIVNKSYYFRLAEPTLIVPSIIPNVSECAASGTGYVNAFNPFTGGRLSYGTFDVNNNNDFSDDLINDQVISSVDFGEGMPGEIVLIGDQLTVGTSTGKIATKKLNTGVIPIRGRINWREVIEE